MKINKRKSIMELGERDDFYAIRNRLIGTSGFYNEKTILSIFRNKEDGEFIIKCPRCNIWKDYPEYLDMNHQVRYICKNCRLLGNF